MYWEQMDHFSECVEIMLDAGERRKQSDDLAT
jgi:hypothetical protein